MVGDARGCRSARQIRGVAQSGRAFGWGPKGRWFKSSRPDHLLMTIMKIYYTTTSNFENAKKITKKLLNDKKAVCINVIKDVKSFYIEEKKLNEINEVILIIKTNLSKKKIEEVLTKIHNYETPLIIELKTSLPNTKYHEWFLKNCK